MKTSASPFPSSPRRRESRPFRVFLNQTDPPQTGSAITSLGTRGLMTSPVWTLGWK